MKKNEYSEVLKLIKDYGKIILIRHENPDYDAYGSQFGLYYALKENFKHKTILLDGDDNINNFYNVPMDNLTDNDYKGALVILTDQSAVNMLRDERFRIADKLIILDHHESEPDFGDLVIIKPSYSSASELITEFLYESKLSIPKKSADALYIGMVGDSFRFYYKGTTSNTFLMASVLLEAGADIINDYKLMTKDEDESYKRIKGYVLSNFIIDKKVAYVIVPKKIRDSIGVNPNQSSRGTINLLSGLLGCEAWVNFTESDNNEYFVEFRSKEKPIVEVAKSIGGGGHELACGATIPVDTNIQNIIDKLNEVIKWQYMIRFGKK